MANNELQQYDTAQQAIAVKKNNELTKVMANSASWTQFMRNLPQVQQKQIPHDVFAYVNTHADTIASLDANEFMARVVECYSRGYTLTDGDAFILPFWSGKEKRNVATLIPGWVGIKRRAMETGMFKYFTVSHVYKESIKGYDYRREVPIFDETFIPKGTEKVIGYLGYYEMFSGAVQEIFCSVEQLERHALKYSPQSKKAGTLVGVWKDCFDAMCMKTMYRKLGSLAPKTKNPTQQQEKFYDSLEESDDSQYIYPEPIDADGVVSFENDETLFLEDDLKGQQSSDLGANKGEFECEYCGCSITEKVYNYSLTNFGHPLCFNCQKNGR